jgi:hypothetical protein
LAFMRCQQCDALTVVCEEDGTIFPSPRDLSQYASGAGCPHCGALGRLAEATGEQILAAGFDPSEYC